MFASSNIKIESQTLRHVYYAYVLMKNHIHLLFETSKHPPARTTQRLQFTFSQYDNRRYNKTGYAKTGVIA